MATEISEAVNYEEVLSEVLKRLASERGPQFTASIADLAAAADLDEPRHRQAIYRTLKNLEERGLVVVIARGRPHPLQYDLRKSPLLKKNGHKAPNGSKPAEAPVSAEKPAEEPVEPTAILARVDAIVEQMGRLKEERDAATERAARAEEALEQVQERLSKAS